MVSYGLPFPMETLLYLYPSPKSVKKTLPIAIGLAFCACVTTAQPSLTLSVGSAAFIGDDNFALSKTWSTPGNPSDEVMGFFAGASGLHVKGVLAWEVSDFFSAGPAMQLLNLTSAENFRKIDIVSLGGHFRVNFSSSQKQWVPFIQGVFYFSNSQTYDQKQATNSSYTPPQVQPAFNLTGTTSIAFNVDLGLEYMIMKSMGIQVTAGFNGLQPIDEVPASVDYSPYFTPRTFDGGFSITLAGGIKYYFGRGDKKRDF